MDMVSYILGRESAGGGGGGGGFGGLVNLCIADFSDLGMHVPSYRNAYLAFIEGVLDSDGFSAPELDGIAVAEGAHIGLWLEDGIASDDYRIGIYDVYNDFYTDEIDVDVSLYEEEGYILAVEFTIPPVSEGHFVCVGLENIGN